MAATAKAVEANSFLADQEQFGPLPPMLVRVEFESHSGDFTVEGGTSSDVEGALRVAAISRLKTIATAFDPEDPREAPIFIALMNDIRSLEGGDEILLSKATSLDPAAAFGPSTRSDYLTRTVEKPKEVAGRAREGSSAQAKAITEYGCDYGEEWCDAAYMPVAGTSTIFMADTASNTGTLQKFWFDASALEWYADIEDGIEIDTYLWPRSDFKCASGDANSNMPYWYRDTEACDKGGELDPRICGMGSNAASELEPDHLYWTWSGVDKVTEHNPYVRVVFQPSKWFPYVLDRYDCSDLGPWCMTSRSDMPIQWVVEYAYSDAPDPEPPYESHQEVEWERD